MENVQKPEENYWQTKDCASLKLFLNKVTRKINHGWIFRGNRDDTRPLQHSFERACTRFNIIGEDRIRVEYNMIREFKRRLYHYTLNTPLKNATDEWLALMQHHGAPTRLLDFTYSPYVAAYFAFEHAKAKENVVVWAVDAVWFSDKFKSISKDKNKKYLEYGELREEHEDNFDYIFRSKIPTKFVLTVNPFRLNERLAYQRGVFLCPGDVSVPFEDNLSVYRDKTKLKKHIIKYRMPTGNTNESTKKTLEYLDAMNINRITLFPGLDGFAQSFEPRIDSLFMRQYGH